jgi:hypothetical protein
MSFTPFLLPHPGYLNYFVVHIRSYSESFLMITALATFCHLALLMKTFMPLEADNRNIVINLILLFIYICKYIIRSFILFYRLAYSSSYIFMVIISKRSSWAGYTSHIVELKSAYKILVWEH